MEIIKPSTTILAMTAHPEFPFSYFNCPEKLMETCGRTCYKSESAITEESAKKFVADKIKARHLTISEHSWQVRIYENGWNTDLAVVGNWSKFLQISPRSDIVFSFPTFHLRYRSDMIIAGSNRAFLEAEKCKSELFNINYILLNEHGIRGVAELFNAPFLMCATVRFICDRGVSHELVRHRPIAVSQESTRYVNYTKKGMKVIQPCWVNITPDEGKKSITLNKGDNTWLEGMLEDENKYYSMLKDGWKPEQARSILPNSLKTELCITATFAEWQHIFFQRSMGRTGTPHPQMLEIMQPLHEQFKALEPFFFSEEAIEKSEEKTF